MSNEADPYPLIESPVKNRHKHIPIHSTLLLIRPKLFEELLVRYPTCVPLHIIIPHIPPPTHRQSFHQRHIRHEQICLPLPPIINDITSKSGLWLMRRPPRSPLCPAPDIGRPPSCHLRTLLLRHPLQGPDPKLHKGRNVLVVCEVLEFAMNIVVVVAGHFPL
jgi:hypothetical protein